MPQRLSIPKVRSKMQSLGLNTAKLVERSQLSDSTIDRVLHGRANHYSDFTISRLAIALECPVLELLDDESTSAALTAFTAQTIENVVEEAVAKNVTVVIDNVAPDTPAQVVAESVPNTPAYIPSAQDVSDYFQYIQQQHTAAVSGMQSHLDDLRSECNLWRGICIVLGALLLIVSLAKGVF